MEVYVAQMIVVLVGVVIIVVQDCAYVWGGTAVVDDCGSCVEGTTGLDFNYTQDCEGVCSGSAIVDECDVC